MCPLKGFPVVSHCSNWNCAGVSHWASLVKKRRFYLTHFHNTLRATERFHPTPASTWIAEWLIYRRCIYSTENVLRSFSDLKSWGSVGLEFIETSDQSYVISNLHLQVKDLYSSFFYPKDSAGSSGGLEQPDRRSGVPIKTSPLTDQRRQVHGIVEFENHSCYETARHWTETDREAWAEYQVSHRWQSLLLYVAAWTPHEINHQWFI